MQKDPGLCKQASLVVGPLHFLWSLRIHNLDLGMTLQNRIWYMACCSFWTPPGLEGEIRAHFQHPHTLVHAAQNGVCLLISSGKCLAIIWVFVCMCVCVCKNFSRPSSENSVALFSVPIMLLSHGYDAPAVRCAQGPCLLSTLCLTCTHILSSSLTVFPVVLQGAGHLSALLCAPPLGPHPHVVSPAQCWASVEHPLLCRDVPEHPCLGGPPAGLRGTLS